MWIVIKPRDGPGTTQSSEQEERVSLDFTASKTTAAALHGSSESSCLSWFTCRILTLYASQLHSQEITKPGIQWWFHLFCNGQWRQEAGRECKGCIILVLYAFRPRNCPAWAWSCQTSSWQRNRQWPFSSSPANPIRRPNGFLKNNVITRGLISCLFCWLCQHVMLRPGRLQGFSWLLEFWAICPSLYPPCPGSIKKSCAEWKEQEGGSQEVWVFQFQLCLRQLERAGL